MKSVVLSVAALLVVCAAAQSAPQLPNLPPQVPNATSYNYYLGGSGDASASGYAVPADTAASSGNPRSDTPFDYSTYCYQPGSNGLPRTQAWIENCLKSNARAGN